MCPLVGSASTSKAAASSELAPPLTSSKGRASRLRVLFVMAYPGYLRYYGGTVRLLAARGHDVILAFDTLQKQSEGLIALKGAEGTIKVRGEWPLRKDVWRPLAVRLRGLVDYLRYLHPRFKEARYLRERMGKKVPATFFFLARIGTLPPLLLRAAMWAYRICERAIPSSRIQEEFLKAINPDVLVVTPIVNPGSTQVDLIKAANVLGLRTAVGIASWDHLTTKGLIRTSPDRVIVWNETQKQEAVELHGIAPSRVVVTGAQPFDDWFERRPAMSREEFCQTVGLSPSQPFVLFVGSTASITAPDAEIDFVRQWIAAVRSSPSLGDVGILIRPHPYNSAHWRSAELAEFTNVAIWPRNGANPVDPGDRTDYFASLYYSAVVVGINTSAMVEASIVGRPVLTILTSAFRDTQSGTLHFHYLLNTNGGCAQVARSLDEHLNQLVQSLNGHRADERTAQFVQSFVRPRGVQTPCTPFVADVIEALGRLSRPRPRRVPIMLWPLTGLLWLLASALWFRDVRKARRGHAVMSRHIEN